MDEGEKLGLPTAPGCGTAKKGSTSTQYCAHAVLRGPPPSNPVQLAGRGPGMHVGWPAPISSTMPLTDDLATIFDWLRDQNQPDSGG